MKSIARISCRWVIAVGFVASAGAVLAQPPRADSLPTLERILGRAGARQPGGVIKFSFPRTDLVVVVDGVTLKPAFALGGWVAFKKTGRATTMAMGDLVLTEDEVDPVMRALQAGGVEQTAVHNHLLGESPRIVYVHLSAHGDEARIATAIHNAVSATRIPAPVPSAFTGAPPPDLDTAGIAKALRYSGTLNGAIYQVSIARPERIRDQGEEIPPSMGVATAINFQPTGGGHAAISGDFVLRGREVNPVIRAFQSHGIRTTALHSHMLMDDPRLFFMHFWAQGEAVVLAKGLRAALDEMSLKNAPEGN